jgi:hypothetical protein
MYEPAWDAGEWDDFWDSTPHDANEFESTPPPPCKHSAIRKPVLEAHGTKSDPVVWAWVCRLCGAAMYEVPEVNA